MISKNMHILQIDSQHILNKSNILQNVSEIDIIVKIHDWKLFSAKNSSLTPDLKFYVVTSSFLANSCSYGKLLVDKFCENFRMICKRFVTRM